MTQWLLARKGGNPRSINYSKWPSGRYWGREDNQWMCNDLNFSKWPSGHWWRREETQWVFICMCSEFPLYNIYALWHISHLTLWTGIATHEKKIVSICRLQWLQTFKSFNCWASLSLDSTLCIYSVIVVMFEVYRRACGLFLMYDARPNYRAITIYDLIFVTWMKRK